MDRVVVDYGSIMSKITVRDAGRSSCLVTSCIVVHLSNSAVICYAYCFNLRLMFFLHCSNVYHKQRQLHYFRIYCLVVVVVIGWQLDLQLPVQSVPITTKAVSLSVTPVSSTNKTDRYDTTEILLKVALNTITLTPTIYCLRDWVLQRWKIISRRFIVYNINVIH